MRDDHYEYIGSDPTGNAEGELVFYDAAECRDECDLAPDSTIWRRRVTYGPWEAVSGEGDAIVMRRFTGIVAAEGKETTDKRIIGQGALTLPTEPVPLHTIGTDGDAVTLPELVGKFTGFRRHGLFIACDGLTTLEKGEYGVGVDLMDMTAHTDEEGVLRITSGRIAGASVVDNPAWPHLAVIVVE